MNKPNIKVVKTGDRLVVYADNRWEALQGAKLLAAKGAKILSGVSQLGAKWIVTVEDIRERDNVAQVLDFGGTRMIKGPNHACVLQKMHDLISAGANVIQQPSEATGGGWIAIVDKSAEVYKW